MCTSKCADCLQRGRQDIHMRAPARGAIDSVAVVGGTTSAVDGMTSTVSGTTSADEWTTRVPFAPPVVIKAITRGEVKKLGKWLRKELRPDAYCPDDGDRLIHIAVVNRQPEIMRELIKYGANLDLPNKDRATPLHLASQMGARPEVELLLQHSADVNRSTRHGVTPLMTAAAHEQPEAVSLLLAAAAVVDMQTNDGFSALMSAASAGACKCCSLLLEAGASVDLTNENGHTACRCAQLKGHTKCARLLLQRASKSRTTPPSPLNLAADPRDARYDGLVTAKESEAVKLTADCRLHIPEKRLPHAACSEERRNKRSLHRATGALARDLRSN